MIGLLSRSGLVPMSGAQFMASERKGVDPRLSRSGSQSIARRSFGSGSAALLLLVLGRTGTAQEATSPWGAPPTGPPGLIAVGPFYLTPTLHIGALGLDTNVFYTPTQRQTDFTTTGGPGLDVVLPVASATRLYTSGDINYVYYLRTTSQRKFGGDAKVGGEYKGDNVKFGIEESYTRSFQRPNFQVDERILMNQQSLQGDLGVRLGRRLTVEGTETYSNTRVDPGQVFDGANLQQTLSRDESLSLLQFKYGLTVKTSLLAGADFEADRFPFEASRSADSDHIFGGFEIKSDTRLAGRAVAGVRLFRPLESSVQKEVPYADVALIYSFGLRTQLKMNYTHDLIFSAFDTTGPTPTVLTETEGASLDIGFGTSGFDLILGGLRSTLKTDGAITVVFAPNAEQTAIRSDTVWQASANLGYRFRSRLRIGVAANYVSRQSTFADFGISGLIVGGTVTYDPNKH
jgi:hypothetical protein